MTARTQPETANAARDTYEEVPYASYPIAAAQPGRLAGVASLFGIDSPAIASCRVLELGCGTGDNLLAMALALPDASFVGVDLSQRQIDEANSSAAQLALKSARFIAADLRELPADIGQFDYVIAHGVFSWVPTDVQEALLAVCRRVLAPMGVAYVSYNTNPGWRIKSVTRDFLLDHLKHSSSPAQRLSQAQHISRYVVDAGLAVDGLAALSDFAASANRKPDTVSAHGPSQQHPGYLFHEYLEAVNEPVYFRDFMHSAARHGLQFLAEADISNMYPLGMNSSVAQTLDSYGQDVIGREQHLDFLTGRCFRQTLLCRTGVPVTRAIEPSRLFGLSVASELSCQAQTPPDIHCKDVLTFSLNGVTIGVTEPIVKAALFELSESWPARVDFEELMVRARARLTRRSVLVQQRSALEQDRLVLAQELAQLACTGCAEVAAGKAVARTTVSDLPVASRWARWRASQNLTITNSHQRAVQLGDFEIQLLLLLDGSHDYESLVDKLSQVVQRDDLVVVDNGTALTDDIQIRQTIANSLTANLRQLSDFGLLVA